MMRRVWETFVMIFQTAAGPYIIFHYVNLHLDFFQLVVFTLISFLSWF